MTNKQQELYVAYIFNKRGQLQEDINVLQNNIRWRHIDSVDCLELIIAQARLEMFEEMISTFDVLFKMCPASSLKRSKKRDKRN